MNFESVERREKEAEKRELIKKIRQAERKKIRQQEQELNERM
jgi:hypothetical protein